MKYIEVHRKDGVATIWLNRQESKNAVNLQMCSELVSALHQCDDSQADRVIVLRGKGCGFSAGGDIKAMRSKTDMFAGDERQLRVQYMRGIQQITKAIYETRTPTVAAIHGYAIGAGLDFALYCDLRLAESATKFAHSFAKLGIISGDGGLWMLTRLVGVARAKELAITGKRFSAQDALTWGLVHEIYESLDHGLEQYLPQLLDNSSDAVAMTKELIQSAPNETLQDHLDRCSAYQGLLQLGKDHKESLGIAE